MKSSPVGGTQSSEELAQLMLDQARRHDFLGAKSIADELLQQNPRQPMIRVHRIGFNEALGLMDQALDEVNLLISNHPRRLDLYFRKLRLLEAMGHFDEACEIADRLRASCVEDPYLTLIQAKSAYHRGDYERTVMLTRGALTATAFPPDARINFLFLCGTAYDKLDQPDKAMEALELANSLHGTPFRKEEFTSEIAQLLALYNRQTATSIPRSMSTSERPVFLVSMARSGSSLVHQIVDNNSAAHGVGESGYFVHQRRKMMQELGESYPANLLTMPAKALDSVAAGYLDGPGKPFEVDVLRTLDKSLDNFRDLGFIWQTLPRARYIYLKRTPIDCCFSIYQHRFVSPNNFTSRLEDIAFVYKMQERMKTHWKEVLQIPVLELTYEDLISDSERQIRRIMNFLEIPWDEQCLRFYDSKRIVNTMSRNQVRRPIYRESVGKGEKYAKYMVEARRILESD